jgi:integrase
MQINTLPGRYLFSRNGRYYFHRKVSGQQIRVSLRTKDPLLASQHTRALYIFTNSLKRLGVSTTDIRKLTKNKAELLHEDAIGQSVDAVTCNTTQPTDLQSRKDRPLLSQDTTPSVDNPLLISASIEEAAEDIKRTGGGSDENIRKYIESWTELIELNPGCSFHDFKFKDAKSHLNKLLLLPNRRTVKAQYKHLSITRVTELDIPPEELLSATSINERMKRLSRLWQWATEHEAYEGANPFTSRTLRLQEKPRERGRYSSSDIQLILSSPLYADRGFQASCGATKSWWWLILLALYSGARCGELAQLTIDDIQLREGVWCLSINDEGDKRVKTSAGIRLCPIHPQLLQIGFIEYIAYLKEHSFTHVLPYPNQNATDVAQRCSKWYCGTYRPNHLPESWVLENKVFHSFRHTFINRAIRELDLPLHQVQSIVGHESSNMGETKRYAKGLYKVEDLAAVMAEFNYEDVDLGCLRGGWKELSDL